MNSNKITTPRSILAIISLICAIILFKSLDSGILWRIAVSGVGLGIFLSLLILSFLQNQKNE